MVNLDLNLFKVEYTNLQNYVHSENMVHFVLDFSLIMRHDSSRMLRNLRGFPQSHCRFYVSESLNGRITQLIEDNGLGFCSELMLKSIVPAWEELAHLRLHPIDQKMTPYDFFVQLWQKKNAVIFITGNETAAWKHILEGGTGDVILVTDTDTFSFSRYAYPILREAVGSIEPRKDREIHDDGSSGKCKITGGSGLFPNRKQTLLYREIISGNGAEGIIYRTNKPYLAVKAFDRRVSEQKIKKIEHFIHLADKKINFAWPLNFVYSATGNSSEPIGFAMPLFTNIRPLEELPYLNTVTAHIRWKIAVNFLANTLYLYLHGIQIGDYNFNNFGLTDDCQVVFMDVDSYVYGKWGTQVHGRQVIPLATDYSDRLSIIQADYCLLNSIVFWILSDGIWPYFYNEDSRQITYCTSNNFYRALYQFPTRLKEYFNVQFRKTENKDPFELLFILLDSENDFT